MTRILVTANGVSTKNVLMRFDAFMRSDGAVNIDYTDTSYIQVH